MNPETEQKLLTLAREIKELDKAIVKERMEKGKREWLWCQAYTIDESINRGRS